MSNCPFSWKIIVICVLSMFVTNRIGCAIARTQNEVAVKPCSLWACCFLLSCVSTVYPHVWSNPPCQSSHKKIIESLLTNNFGGTCRWVTNIAGLAIMSLMGEWLCARREMSEIPVTSLRNRGAGSTQMTELKRSDSKSKLLGGANNV